MFLMLISVMISTMFLRTDIRDVCDIFVSVNPLHPLYLWCPYDFCDVHDVGGGCDDCDSVITAMTIKSMMCVVLL
jgi:hypothetical protein